MPNREVKLRRWEVGASFVLLAATFALAIFLVQRERDARVSAIRAEQNARIAALAANAKQLNALALASCRSRDALVEIDIDALSRGITESRSTLRTSPAAKLPGIREILVAGIRTNRRLLVKARRATCDLAALRRKLRARPVPPSPR